MLSTTDAQPSEILLRQRFAVLTRTLPLAQSGDVTAIHEARVATRRVRAALPLVSHGAKGRKLKKAVSRLTRALGVVRDLDVALQTLGELASDATLQSDGIDQLASVMTEERQHHYLAMVRELDRVDLERLQRKVMTAARKHVMTAGQAESDPKGLKAVAKRAVRRAESLQEAIENAGGIYLPDRLHQVRIAVKKLRYTLEIARELSRSRATARIRTLKSAQDLLGRMHDFEVLITRIRALQGSDRAPTLKVSADLDRLVRHLEMECRQLHVRYTEFKKKLLELCDHVTAADDRRPASAA